MAGQTSYEMVIDGQKTSKQEKDQQQVVEQRFPQPQPTGIKSVGSAGAKLFLINGIFESRRHNCTMLFEVFEINIPQPVGKSGLRKKQYE